MFKNETKILALVDCNNFYVSCERIFNPKLLNRPVVVLSVNDGCIVARSNEAKALGIPMGAAIHDYEKIIRRHQGVILSSNYPLYANLSNRVMRCLSYFTPDIEYYSIDEAFLCLDKLSLSPQETAEQMRLYILKCLGIPVSIGLGSTKVLAKAANHIAKKNKSGIFSLEENNSDAILQTLAVEDLWGISGRLKKRLNSLGIFSALELKTADSRFMRSQFGVVMQRMVLELQGQSCLPLEAAAPRKNILTSKSFGYLVVNFQDLREALSHYVLIAVKKLRDQHSLAAGLCVFVQTNPFKKDEPQYNNSKTVFLESPSNDYGYIMQAALKLLQELYKPGFRYKKTGIYLVDLISEEVQQGSLLEIAPKRDKLMKVFDAINAKYGKDSLFYAAQGVRRAWKSKCSARSPAYVSSWQELAKVY